MNALSFSTHSPKVQIVIIALWRGGGVDDRKTWHPLEELHFAFNQLEDFVEDGTC